MIDNAKAIGRKKILYPAWRSFYFSWMLMLIIIIIPTITYIFYQFNLLLMLIPLFLITLLLIIVILKRMHYKYELTHHFVKSELGILTRREQELHISDIRMVSVDQSIIDRILNVGDVHVASPATDSVEIIMKNIDDPLKIKRIINLLKHQYTLTLQRKQKR